MLKYYKNMLSESYVDNVLLCVICFHVNMIGGGTAICIIGLEGGRRFA